MFGATSGARAGTGTTYYVSPTGSDAADGKSPGSAWQTLGKVNGFSFTAGDTVLFQGGQSFSGTITAGQSGVTYSSYAPGQATISSTNAVGFTCTNLSNVTVDGLIFTGAGSTTNTSNGVFFTNTSGSNTKLSNVRVSNCTISGYGICGILVSGGAGTSGFNGVTISQNVISNCTGKAAIGDGGANTGSNAGILVCGFTDPGVSHYNVNIIGNEVKNCNGFAASVDNTGNGIQISETSVGLIDGCWVHSCGSLSGQSNDGIILWFADSVTIQRCEVARCECNLSSAGIDIDGACTNCICQYCYVHECIGTSFACGTFAAVGTWNNNTFRYNISQNSSGGEFLIGNGGGAAMTNLLVYNNTFFNNLAISSLATTVSNSSVTTTWANNIFFSNSANYFNFTVVGTWVFTGNDYINGLNWIWNGTGYATLAAWQAATGQEKIAGVSVGLTSNPGFVNGGGGGDLGGYFPGSLGAYKFSSASSPMVGVGINMQTQYSVNPGKQDFYGTVIPDSNGKYDVGAYKLPR